MDAIIAESVGKCYQRPHANRPRSVHEALLRGFDGLRSTEDFWALRDVSLRVPRGTTLGVIGRNGAGKSTLLRLLGGVEAPTVGTVTTHGHVGALLSIGAGFHLDLTGRENVLVSATILGLTRAEALAELDSILEFADIGAFVDEPVRVYSAGMHMRLRFAVAIHVRPDMLLIDEIFSVGDMEFRDKCLDRIEQIRAEGSTIVLVSHALDMVAEMADNVIWLDRGEVRGRGDPSDVIRAFKDSYPRTRRPTSAHRLKPASPPPPSDQGFSAPAH